MDGIDIQFAKEIGCKRERKRNIERRIWRKW